MQKLIPHMEHAVTMRRRIGYTLAAYIGLIYKVCVSSCQLTARRPGRYQHLKSKTTIYTKINYLWHLKMIELYANNNAKAISNWVLLLSLPAGFYWTSGLSSRDFESFKAFGENNLSGMSNLCLNHAWATIAWTTTDWQTHPTTSQPLIPESSPRHRTRSNKLAE